MNVPAWLRHWLTPAPDSAVAEAIRRGKSPWTDAVHLLWTLWIFLTPLFNDGYNARWLLLTALSYPLFLWLYAKVLLAPRRNSWRYAVGMAVLSLVLLRWYPSGLSYFVFGCVTLRTSAQRPSLRAYILQLLAMNAVFVAVAILVDYPWQVWLWVPAMTLVIGIILNVEHASQEKDAALALSHEEVRRLAATAERERIGRDLHDLLGHTLSLITLKLELSRKLIDRDAAASRRELEEAECVARDALAQVRSAVTGIRSADLAAELASARLLLESSCVALDYDPPPSLGPEIERPLALVLREAATNIARHAQAAHAEVRFEREVGQLRMRIADDGRGAAAGEGNGVNGMRERVRALGGNLEFASSKAGTTVEAVVPLPALEPGA